MSARLGLLGGFLGLTALEAVLSTKGSAERVGGLLGWAGTAFARIADPTVPAIPYRGASGAVSSADLGATIGTPSDLPISPTSPTLSPATGGTRST